jgi:uncharacterized protein with HEPN domain
LRHPPHLAQAKRSIIVLAQFKIRYKDEMRFWCTQLRGEIPWRVIAGFRDVAAHKYQTLNMTDVWNMATTDVLGFKEKLETLLVSDDA